MAGVLRAAKTGQMNRRQFMSRAASAGMMFSPLVARAATSGDEVSPRKFFPASGMPAAVRERLANRLLGRLRVTDPAFDDYYMRVAAELSPEDDFLVVTAASDDINAFAHYGGLIVMMRGMWRFAENEDALLGIVAHEMGHVKLDHFKSKKELNERVTALSVPLLIAGLLAGNAEVRESIIVGGSGIITGQIYGHSRELEHEADVIGLKLLVGSGRDGRQVSSLLGNLAGTDNEYISTHPAPARRAAYIKDRLLGRSETPPVNSLDFLLLREKLFAVDGGTPEFVNDKLLDLSRASGDEKIALQFGVLLSATRDKDTAAKMDTALADISHPFIVAARANYASRNGEHGRAEMMVKAASIAHPQSAALAMQYAQVLRRAGKHAALLAAHDAMPPLLQERVDILREVSQSASALNRNAEANLFLARAHVVSGAFELAEKQLDIAERFKMNTKMLVRANKIRNIAKREIAMLAKNQ